MGVLGNYYNYQIAVIFAILIGGCIVLGGTVAGIYYICVNNMREDKKKLTARSSPAPWVESSVQYRPAEPMAASSQQGFYQPQQQQQPQYSMPPPASYAPQYETGYTRSVGLPSPQSVQPQPLLTPQNYDMYRPQYDDTRMVSMQQPRSYNQSSV